jgi:hypothetical protein
LYDEGVDPAALVQALAEQEGPLVAAEFVGYWQQQEQEPLTADQYLQHLQQRGQAQAMAERLIELRAQQLQREQNANAAVEQVEQILPKQYLQRFQQPVADVLMLENQTGTSPLDGMETPGEVAAHLRGRFALAESYERLNARAALKRDFDQQTWMHRGEGFMDGSHPSMELGQVPDHDWYLQQEIDAELKAGRVPAARPSREEAVAHTHAQFAGGPMQTTQKALDAGWNLSPVDEGQKMQQERIAAARRR